MNDQRRFLKATVLAITMGTILSASPTAHAQAFVLRDELGILAKNVSTIRQVARDRAIAVGQFTGPKKFPSSAGPGIVSILTQELEKLGINVRAKANLEIKGDYLALQSGNEPKSLVGRIKARILDTETGETITELQRDVAGPGANSDLAALFGINVDLKNKPQDVEEGALLISSVTKPNTAVDQTIVKAGPNSPFGIEILIQQSDGSYQPRAAKIEDGRAFVQIKRGETYAVRLVNASPDETVGVLLTIDGINVFHFSEDRNPQTGYSKASRWILEPGKTGQMVKGWVKNAKKADSFKVTSYAESVAASANLGGSDEIGTITATFCVARSLAEQKFAKQVFENRLDDDATGRGAEVDQVITTQRYTFLNMLASVSVRYTK